MVEGIGDVSLDNQESGAERELKQVPGDWFDVDGIAVENDVGQTGTKKEQGRIYSIEDLNGDQRTMDSVGNWEENNGVICYVDQEGHAHVAGYTEERARQLEEAGYKHRATEVPLSSGSGWVPADPELRKRWEKMIEADREKRQKEIAEARKKTLRESRG